MPRASILAISSTRLSFRVVFLRAIRRPAPNSRDPEPPGSLPHSSSFRRFSASATTRSCGALKGPLFHSADSKEWNPFTCPQLSSRPVREHFAAWRYLKLQPQFLFGSRSRFLVAAAAPGSDKYLQISPRPPQAGPILNVRWKIQRDLHAETALGRLRYSFDCRAGRRL